MGLRTCLRRGPESLPRCLCWVGVLGGVMGIWNAGEDSEIWNRRGEGGWLLIGEGDEKEKVVRTGDVSSILSLLDKGIGGITNAVFSISGVFGMVGMGLSMASSVFCLLDAVGTIFSPFSRSQRAFFIPVIDFGVWRKTS